ncbi:hypothetical protein [Stenotrophomonas maltophilia]|uniref:hypothetical protein n=1 Tax=Stenotrophomonas maltophilia TaxID=40324 RepID=UPI000C1597E2|nr:hypothetical protein [Stenotrophomonas maltophilia]HDS3802509.1 hypothetical protein [Stenotrophomonas maltophilia]HDX0828558.1 hypothetical protein [Stenotrophomonas maltophilia]HDX0845708.1 hypothetical protein [Stenotrophomonas maltophilia]HDX0869607.1 hypothetical protein [Stenotrophomonas maltophilia]HEL4208440.1 hypothetical protein [Stenotrophomonas maltophilia]
MLQALYTESLHAREDVDAIDRMLDAHREAFGEPEQVAYARQQDERHDRALPLPSGGLPLKPSMGRYLEEHRSWNPPTAKEAAIARSRGLAMVLEGKAWRAEDDVAEVTVEAPKDAPWQRMR